MTLRTNGRGTRGQGKLSSGVLVCFFRSRYCRLLRSAPQLSMFLVGPYTKHFSFAEWNGAGRSPSRTVYGNVSIAEWNGLTSSRISKKTTSAPNASVAPSGRPMADPRTWLPLCGSCCQRFTVLGDILSVAATPHTREQEQLRQGRPKVGRKHKQKIRKDL